MFQADSQFGIRQIQPERRNCSFLFILDWWLPKPMPMTLGFIGWMKHFQHFNKEKKFS